MRVVLMSQSFLTRDGWDLLRELIPYQYSGNPATNHTSCEALIEFAGRNCYQSWSNPSGRTNAEYIGNLLDHGHGSVLEHATATFYVAGVSRSFTHELERHRHLSFSELSQRYVNMETPEFIRPPAFGDDEALGMEFDCAMGDAIVHYKRLVARLETIYASSKRKAVREAARCVLPNATETKLVVTGNFRAWRGVIDQRATEQADAEIRGWAVETCRQLKEYFPHVFGDYEIHDGYATTEIKKV